MERKRKLRMDFGWKTLGIYKLDSSDLVKLKKKKKKTFSISNTNFMSYQTER